MKLPPLVAVMALATALSGCGGEWSELPAASPTDAILRLDIDNCRGLAHQRATAVRVADGLVITVAHSFYVDDELSVSTVEAFDGKGESVDIEIVYLDPETDVAVLRVIDDADASIGLEFADYLDDSSVRVATFSTGSDASGADEPVVRDLTVAQLTEVTLDGAGARQALELVGEIEPGDSGAPVLNDDGQIIGIVFASSKSDATGWAIAAEELTEALTQPRQTVELGCT